MVLFSCLSPHGKQGTACFVPNTFRFTGRLRDRNVQLPEELALQAEREERRGEWNSSSIPEA